MCVQLFSSRELVVQVSNIFLNMSDEKLAEAIRKYPVIYDKREKGHKDKILGPNAWAKVVEGCGLEDLTSPSDFGD